MQWRSDVLFTEDFEAIFTKHLKLIEQIFDGYSHGSGLQKHLKPQDWFDLLDAFDVLPCTKYPTSLEEHMNAWNRAWLWQVSSSSVADELTGSAHLELIFVDFLEALARLPVLIRARKKAFEAPQAERDRWDCGLPFISPPCAFAA